ncbi:MerR family transcriptional regulator, partial [bacterium]|nr:MerR family transcriptional regulator [bacterium]
MYSISECSRITSLSIKALRIYHEKGLLVPAVVDRATGYRYYSSENIQKAQVIRQLRDMQFGLDDIKGLLEAGTDEEAVFACLEKQKQAMRTRVEESKAIIQALDTILEAEKEAQTIMEQEQFEVLEKTVDEMLIAGIRYKGKYCECGEKFGALFR